MVAQFEWSTPHCSMCGVFPKKAPFRIRLRNPGLRLRNQPVSQLTIMLGRRPEEELEVKYFNRQKGYKSITLALRAARRGSCAHGAANDLLATAGQTDRIPLMQEKFYLRNQQAACGSRSNNPLKLTSSLDYQGQVQSPSSRLQLSFVR